MKLVIVESPAKAKTINKYLGSDFKVIASFGHIRDLPSKNGSVKPDEDFEMVYEVPAKSTKHVKDICSAAKGAEAIYLATDPDREGEGISWHVVEILKEKKAISADTPVYRVAFNEITKKAVNEAVANPRRLDDNLIGAQQARRALDYLVGFTLSPVLWTKLPGSKSAGRVQSVALRLICERENEIEHFRTQEYWSITLDLNNIHKKLFQAKLTHVDGKKLEKFDVNNEVAAKTIVEQLQNQGYYIKSVEKKEQRRSPNPPFTTSTLQQEASRKLGFSAKKTMQIAQKLYEGVDLGGETVALITYMRTDGVSLSEDAVKDTRKLIAQNYGDEYVPASPNVYKAKSQNAQEAHEAIRPTDVSILPERVNKELDRDYARLYELIWKRTVACQMAPAILNLVNADIETNDKKYIARANGSSIKFKGFYAVYRESVDEDNESTDEEKMLPDLNEGETAELVKILPKQHFTEPPPRYTEASLVKKLEELGIGRPSTYASILSVIQERNYVKLQTKRFYPEARGRIVTAFLVQYFPRYVEYDFTAGLEDELDNIAEGKLFWKDLLRKFWQDFSSNVGEIKNVRTGEVIDSLNTMLEDHLFPKTEENPEPRKCPSCKNGILSLKMSRYGAFVGCSNYPECNFTKQILQEGDEPKEGEEAGEQVKPQKEEYNLGASADNKNIYLKNGPYGWYIQLGENTEKPKPKRVPIKGIAKPEEVDLAKAKFILDLPKVIGKHSQTGEDVTLGVGKFGPYLLHQGKYDSIKGKDLFDVKSLLP